MADFLLSLVSTVTIFSSTILLWLKKATMFEFCRIRSYLLPRWHDELLLGYNIHVALFLGLYQDCKKKIESGETLGQGN